MKKSFVKAIAASMFSVTLATSMLPVGALQASATGKDRYWSAPDSAVNIDTSNILKTYGVRAGSAGPDFLGITNTNFDFSSASPTAYAQSQYTGYSANDLSGVVGAGLAIWATSVNENPNPFYVNLYYSAFYDAASTPTKATTWVGNPDTSSWGDSNGIRSQKDDGSYTVNGLEYSPEIIFGANKTTNWGNFDSSQTVIAQSVASDPNYSPTFTNNDSTNLWTQVYTLNQLAGVADTLTAQTGKTTRYNSSNATTSALSYEKALRGNLLYIASQIDTQKIEKKTVAYLYAIDNGTGYFFVPDASGLTNGTDTGKEASSSVAATADASYASNNGTIDLGYMDTLPFITNTFSNGTPVAGGIVMRVEDIYKSNPAVSVGGSQTDALNGVDVIIYNSTTATDLAGVSGGKNSSGINNSSRLTKSTVTTWAQAHGFTGSLVIAGDDFGTSSNQGYGTVDATEEGMSPLLYCQRNYTTDKPARAAWAFSKVYPELYPNEDASYAYWVDEVYHINIGSVPTVVAYMTNQSDLVTYDANTLNTMELHFQTGLDWWNSTGSKKAEWSQYAYYTGASRASYYDGLSASEVSSELVGIFAPTQSWQQATPYEDKSDPGDTKTITAQRLEGQGRYDTMAKIVSTGFESSDVAVLATGANFPDALAASSLAGVYNAPVLLTETAQLSSQAQTELTRLGVQYVYILGGESSVSKAVEDQLSSMGITPVRVAGESRQETSLKAFSQVIGQSDSCDTVIIAAGKSFPDTLSVSPYAYAKNAPILLTTNDGVLTNQAVDAIKETVAINNVIIVGGESSVSEQVKAQLGQGYVYKRLSGNDRYETSAAIAQFELEQGMSAQVCAVATGRNYPDALAGAALSGAYRSILLLADAVNCTSATGVLSEQKGIIQTLYVYGGESSVSAEVVTQCQSAASE